MSAPEPVVVTVNGATWEIVPDGRGWAIRTTAGFWVVRPGTSKRAYFRSVEAAKNYLNRPQ